MLSRNQSIDLFPCAPGNIYSHPVDRPTPSSSSSSSSSSLPASPITSSVSHYMPHILSSVTSHRSPVRDYGAVGQIWDSDTATWVSCVGRGRALPAPHRAVGEIWDSERRVWRAPKKLGESARVVVGGKQRQRQRQRQEWGPLWVFGGWGEKERGIIRRVWECVPEGSAQQQQGEAKQHPSTDERLDALLGLMDIRFPELIDFYFGEIMAATVPQSEVGQTSCARAMTGAVCRGAVERMEYHAV